MSPKAAYFVVGPQKYVYYVKDALPGTMHVTVFRFAEARPALRLGITITDDGLVRYGSGDRSFATVEEAVRCLLHPTA